MDFGLQPTWVCALRLGPIPPVVLDLEGSTHVSFMLGVDQFLHGYV